MEPVVIQEEGREWFYDPDRELYVRMEGEAVTAQIYGKYIPAPSEIIKNAGREATPTVKQLFAHWSSVNAN